MRPTLIICALAVLGALVAPFFLKIGGQPIMTIDEVVDDATPDALHTPTEIYRWQDADGSWHFGQQPPSGSNAESVSVEDKITRMDKGWHVNPLDAGPKPAADFEVPGIAAYADGGKQLMQKATAEVENLNQRTQALEALRKQAR
ncbi:MAG: DUF4124 domain-containing protein [Pseudomonadales bacterium]